MLVDTRMNPTKIQELAMVKNILNNHIVKRDNLEEEEDEEKIKVILDNHAAVEHSRDVDRFNLIDKENNKFKSLKKKRKDKLNKERNVEDVYSAENVENYQGVNLVRNLII